MSGGGKVRRCPACGRVIALTFAMHQCLAPGEERYSFAKWLRSTDAEEAPTAWPCEVALTKEQAVAWICKQRDPSKYAVVRWFGTEEGTDSDRQLDAELFVEDPNVFEALHA